MSDPFKTTTKQEVDILGKAAERKKASSFGSSKKPEEKKAPVRVSELYNAESPCSSPVVSPLSWMTPETTSITGF